MANLMARMRAPGLRGYGLDGSETAGDSDVLSRLASQRELEGYLNVGRQQPMQGRSLAMRPQQAPVNTMGRAVDPNKGPMNVVYDQGPEQFNRQMEQKDRQIDNQAEYNKALAGLKTGALDVQRQNADTNRAKAEAIMARQDLTDSEKQLMIMRQALGVAEVGADSREAVASTQTGSRERVAGADRTSRESEGDKNRTSREEVARMIAEEAAKRAAADDARRLREPGAMAGQINNKARELITSNPEYATAMETDDRGNFTGKVKEGTDELVRSKIMQQLYGPSRAGDINLPGLGSGGLGGQPGASAPAAPAITTPGSSPTGATKFTINGKPYTIPGHLVQSFLAQNPNAQKVQ